MNSGEEAVPQDLAEALRELEQATDPAAVIDSIEALGDVIYEREISADAVGVIARRLALTALFPDGSVQEAAMNVLANLAGWNIVDFDCIAPLVNRLKDLTPPAVEHLVDVLVFNKDDRAAAALEELRSHPDGAVRSAVEEAVQWLERGGH